MKNIYYTILISINLIFFYSCGSNNSEDITSKQFSIPKVGDSFDWRLDNVDKTTIIPANVIDVDAFETTKESIEAWHKAGKYVIAYISVGTVDSTRVDAKDFPSEIIGEKYPNYENESFLNIREIEKLSPIIKKRFDMIKEKGFDGIEPDNIDLYVWDIDGKNQTSFNIKVEDSKKYIDFLIEEAHKRGLSIGQKNANELAPLYVNKFDWLLTESAFSNNITENIDIYTKYNKAVFSVEYTDQIDTSTFTEDVCPKAKDMDITAILKNRELDSYILTCP